MPQRVGVFGGSFDPVHLGHLVVAEQCREQARLDRVLFVPAAQPPHKLTKSLTDPRHRVAMLELAIAGHEHFEVSTVELERSGPSYTVETLEALKQSAPDSSLFLIMGADMLMDFPTWRQPQRILELAEILACNRPGVQVNLDRGRPLSFVDRLRERLRLIQVPEIGISATDIRGRVRAGRSIRYLVPRAVECYIEEHGLYRDPAPRETP